MKIGILHHDLEWAEIQFKKEFDSMGFNTELHDVRNSSFEKISKNDFVLNRVYASVANRDCKSNIRALNLMKDLENNGIVCINSYLTSYADYSKKFSSDIMHENGVPNPLTFKISGPKDIDGAIDFSNRVGFPVILKRDMGGRGEDVKLISSLEDLRNALDKRLFSEGGYDQGYVVQEFLENNRGYDCRIAIIDGRFSFAFSRTLVSKDEKKPWLASSSNGSKKKYYSPSENEIDLAVRATRSIGALYNEVDLTFTDRGPVVIENNPSPNYVEGEDLNDKLSVAAKFIRDKFMELSKGPSIEVPYPENQENKFAFSESSEK